MVQSRFRTSLDHGSRAALDHVFIQGPVLFFNLTIIFSEQNFKQKIVMTRESWKIFDCQKNMIHIIKEKQLQISKKPYLTCFKNKTGQRTVLT
jgi:hypothetical protein